MNEQVGGSLRLGRGAAVEWWPIFPPCKRLRGNALEASIPQRGQKSGNYRPVVMKKLAIPDRKRAVRSGC